MREYRYQHCAIGRALWRLLERLGKLTPDTMRQVERALAMILGIEG
jgi:mRNA-degrading endonuclease toxin of MazEF toxin-antitoxin module